MFIQYLAGEGLNVAKLERKPRRNIQYKDLGIKSLFSYLIPHHLLLFAALRFNPPKNEEF
jgi:hypothetical protein